MFGSPETTTGGMALRFYASVRINLRLQEVIKDKESGEELGRQVNNEVLKKANKIAGLDKARYSGMIAHASDWAIEIWNGVFEP